MGRSLSLIKKAGSAIAGVTFFVTLPRDLRHELHGQKLIKT